MFGQGLTFGIAHGSYTDANGNIVTDYPGVFNIDAIKGNDKVKILANPSLGAQNNVEAEVSVVDNIPITEATITGSGSDRDVIQNITRMDVGVKLTMTPHIIPDGIVQLELEPSIEAVTDKGISSDYAPTISKRRVKTTVMVEDGKTIVIAGLMRNDTAEVKKKIPLLGDIPLLGWLFRWNSTEEKKTNILIFVTPTVISDTAGADALRTDLEKRTGLSSQTITEEMAVPQEAVEAE
jgi:general secretion pathway protein D